METSEQQFKIYRDQRETRMIAKIGEDLHGL